MYKKAYGIIETKAPLHVGASSGEETGNLNLIFRDQFTQTGIIPGSSVRGRFRADMRRKRLQWQQEKQDKLPIEYDENHWYGLGSDASDTTEALVKFEYASIVWLPVFCPGQPIVWISCPRLLQRYQQIREINESIPKPYTASANLKGRNIQDKSQILFFNLGFLEIENNADLSPWIPDKISIPKDNLVVVDNNDMALIHDMALYRQSRVKLQDDMKKVDTGAFFNVEALPEGTILVFPIALKERGWQPFKLLDKQENKQIYPLYFGGLESIGFGRCDVTLGGDI
ncbi:RAMP superfamily CRISPR-associated protein [Cyanothece sp. BG0011]|uniref:RAMP superfamily CRISPR-associated protein n=1 Tax=Cyanothece sp. BG0011 TaxID=2082950 RepID=UPI000D1DEEC8|nr:RAMP superfamily CRISPR-associated protein [Cyanothece sp. BG0011]